MSKHFKRQKTAGDVQNEARVRKRRKVVSVENAQTVASGEKRSNNRKREKTSTV